MKTISNLLSVLFLMFVFNVTAQENQEFYKSYDWDESPIYNVNESDSTDLITYKNKIVHELIYTESGGLIEYDLVHKILWLNSDEAIENNNKVYFPISHPDDLIESKARVVTKTGDVINLDKSKILTAKDEESGDTYKYFTFEGIELGSYVEYIFIERLYPIVKGRRITFQNSHKKYLVQFDLYTPENLIFEFKSYNNLQDIKIDTVIEGKNRWFLHMDTLNALEDEDQAPRDAIRQYLVYKLDRNLATRGLDLSSYGEVSENIFNYVYVNPEKAEIKALKKYAKSIPVNESQTGYQKIRAIEDYIKKNIYHADANLDGINNIQEIIKNNVGGTNVLLKLYGNLFNHFGIKSQIVLTCKRRYMEFDPKFEARNFLTDYLFYFPKEKMFLSPIEISSRLGIPPSNLTNNYGLFVKEVAMGDFKTGIGKIKFIDPVPYDKTFDSRLAEISFDPEDISITTIKMDHSQGGYYAMFSQPIFTIISEETQKEIIESSIKYLNENIEIISTEVNNATGEDFGVKPFQIISEGKTDLFMEKAGDKYLFKVGELIGPQMEMYQAKKRISPLYTSNNRKYHREIKFKVPDGYQINSLEGLAIDKTYKEDDEIKFLFKSTYTIDGDMITIVIDEYYKIMHIKPELYEEYRSVINGAADFNKIVLIIEKKK